MRYTTLLIDLDDTLLDFGKNEEAAVKRIMSEYGIEPTADKVKFYSELNKSKWKQLELGVITREELKATRFCDFFRAMGTEADGVRANTEFMNYISEGNFLMDNAVETCAQLKSRGYSIYAITNGTKWIQEKRLSNSPLKKYFDGIFISEEIGFSKPKKEFFDFVLSHITEKDKKKILVVGDSLSSDIEGAVNSGLDSCWISSDVVLNNKADYQIKNIGDILELLYT